MLALDGVLGVIDELPPFPGLQFLRLTRCRIADNDLHKLEKYSSLSILNLAGNAIMQMTELPSMARLRSLSLADNRVTEIPAFADRFPQLIHLDIRGNRVSTCASLSELSRLRAFECNREFQEKLARLLAVQKQ